MTIDRKNTKIPGEGHDVLSEERNLSRAKECILTTKVHVMTLCQSSSVFTMNEEC